MKQYEHRQDVLTYAAAERDQLLEPELAPLDAAIDDLRTEHLAELEATTRGLTERLNAIELDRSLGRDHPALSRDEHGVDIDYGPDPGW